MRTIFWCQSGSTQPLFLLLFLTFCYNDIFSTCSFTRPGKHKKRVISRTTQNTEYTVMSKMTLARSSTPANMSTTLPPGLPKGFPYEWINGVVPFAYNFYSPSIKRLMTVVKRGHRHIERHSCLVFEEKHPQVLARTPNKTYLYYEYSGALENCCLPFFNEPVGRRMVLITPLCSLSVESAHVTLHGLGLYHSKNSGMSIEKAFPVLFIIQCTDIKKKQQAFDDRIRDIQKPLTDEEKQTLFKI